MMVPAARRTHPTSFTSAGPFPGIPANAVPNGNLARSNPKSYKTLASTQLADRARQIWLQSATHFSKVATGAMIRTWPLLPLVANIGGSSNLERTPVCFASATESLALEIHKQIQRFGTD
jgi:hypothetical protein